MRPALLLLLALPLLAPPPAAAAGAQPPAGAPPPGANMRRDCSKWATGGASGPFRFWYEDISFMVGRNNSAIVAALEAAGARAVRRR